jgi:processive 1,2-diacylglycerol beta-glucosyltransferase
VKKVLLLPFLNMQSGHHQVADALREYIRLAEPNVLCDKVDVLSYGFGKVESYVSGLYMRWIHSFPGTYSWLYKKSAYASPQPDKRFLQYELLFLKAMRKLIGEQKPDLIFCTHCLPSYIVGRLKRMGLISVPAVNIYTDFFINNVWDRQGIDYHFVPDQHIKRSLVAEGVKEDHIFVTGIPVHPDIAKIDRNPKEEKPQIIALLTGGSLGAGKLKRLIEQTSPYRNVTYKVLCGKNKHLFNFLVSQNYPHITPLPYMESKAEINNLYNETDVILTKPGGVTISECIRIGLPILVYHSLPGQEEINFDYLLNLGLVKDWHDWETSDIESRIEQIVRQKEPSDRLETKLKAYRLQLTNADMISTVRHVLQH